MQVLDLLFGGAAAAEEARSDAEEGEGELLLPGDKSLRRSATEVSELAEGWLGLIRGSKTLKRRAERFWPSDEFLQRVVYALAKDVPRHQNPVHAELTVATAAAVAEADLSDGPVELDARPQPKRRERAAKDACVDWLGLTNKVNGYAAIRLTLPMAFEEWHTWTNRVFVFLFARIENYTYPEHFISILRPPEGGPFLNSCSNPRCIRLSHTLVRSSEPARPHCVPTALRSSPGRREAGGAPDDGRGPRRRRRGRHRASEGGAGASPRTTPPRRGSPGASPPRRQLNFSDDVAEL